MNYIRSLMFVLLFFLCFIISAHGSNAEELTKEEVIDLCETTALKFKKKRETIRTWQGVVDVEVSAYKSSITEKIPERFIHAQIEFSVDIVKNNRSFIVTVKEDHGLDKSGNYSENSCDILGGLVRDNVFYRYTAKNLNANGTIASLQLQMPGNTRETLLANRAVSSGHLTIMNKTHSSPETASLLEDFDPFVWLQPRTVPMDERYLTFADFVREYPHFRERLLFEKRDNMFLTKNLPLEELPPDLNTFVVDTTQDFAVVSLISQNYKSGKVAYQWKAELNKEHGLYLPKRIEEISSAGTCLTKVTFIKSLVNSPIPYVNFTLQYLGVRREDRVYDNLTQSESTVTDARFPEAIYKITLNRPRYSWVRYVFMIVGLAMVMFALFSKYRQWRSNRVEKKP